jgi:hypothetical protein
MQRHRCLNRQTKRGDGGDAGDVLTHTRKLSVRICNDSLYKGAETIPLSPASPLPVLPERHRKRDENIVQLW